MSEVAGESTAEKHETEDSMGDAPLDGNLDDIFDDDAGYSGDTSFMGGFENAFDESLSATKKISKAAVAMPNPVTSGESIGRNSSRNSQSSLPPNRPEGEGDVWQDDVADIPHRRELIRQIAQLLRDRKQKPTYGWLKELPYKARKLEEQLYKTAESLEAYLDKATLKHRLKKVAHAITSQFRIAKGGYAPPTLDSTSRRPSKILSTSSEITLGSALGSMSRSNPITSTSFGSGDISDLERQQEVNQKLQEQILENIRQQQQIMRNLMGPGGGNNNSNGQGQGGNQQQGTADMMSASMDSMSQMSQMNSMSQMSQMANQMNPMSQMASQMGGMTGAMGLNSAALNAVGFNAASMNRMSAAGMNGGMGATGMSAAGLGAGMGITGMNSTGMSTAGMGSGMGSGMGAGMGSSMGAGMGSSMTSSMGSNMGTGMGTSGMNAAAAMSMSGRGGGLNMASMNAAGVNPMLAQQLLQQRMAATAGQSSPAAVQMAMMQSLRNSLTGQTNPAGMNAAALMGASSMNSVLHAPSLANGSNSGINPTMPPPSMNAVMRSSFTNTGSSGGTGVSRTASEDEGRSGDLSLSPNSFKW